MKRTVSTLVENQMSNVVMKLLQHARFGRQTERNQPLGVGDVANTSGSKPAGNIKTRSPGRFGDGDGIAASGQHCDIGLFVWPPVR
jgi:hypothetical protein